MVLERPEKAAASLLQQLNAIRNAKAEKRRAASNRWGGWLAHTQGGCDGWSGAGRGCFWVKGLLVGVQGVAVVLFTPGVSTRQPAGL